MAIIKLTERKGQQLNLRKERKISLVFTYEINRDSDMTMLFISISSNPRKKDK